MAKTVNAKPATNGKAKDKVARLPAVLYLRRSDPKQDESIERQRDDLTEFTRKFTFYERGHQYGLRITREYTEDGISGDEYNKRLAFQEMLDDAVHKGDFQVILCWDVKRFGRFDGLEAGYRIYPLREAGIRLITKVDGKQDWNTIGGRINYMVKQESANEDNRSKSANVLPGQIRQAKKGSWIGTPPYGYTIEKVPKPDGEKPYNKLIVGRKGAPGDRTNAKVVQRIFKEFTGPDRRSMTNIAQRLNEDGIDSPGAWKKKHRNFWRFDTVQQILQNRAYIGDFIYNKTSHSKYFHYTNGETTEGARAGKNPESDWIVIPNHHEPIIKKREFEKAQDRLAEGKTGRSPHKPETNPYLFPVGILKCGRCGENLWGQGYRVKEVHDPEYPDDPVKVRIARYHCKTAAYEKDVEGKKGCEGTWVREDHILGAMKTYLQNEFGITEEVTDKLYDKITRGTLSRKDLPEGWDKLKRLMLGKLPKRRDTQRIENDKKKLIADIELASSNLVLLKPERIPAAEKKIQTMEQRLAELKAEIAHQPSDADINSAVSKVLGRLGTLLWPWKPNALKTRVRGILSELESITIHTDISGTGPRPRHRLTRCEFRFKAIAGVTGPPERISREFRNKWGATAEGLKLTVLAIT